MADCAYTNVNKVWKATCRMIFGDEVGELKDYEEWLKEYIAPPNIKYSTVSGKKVKLLRPEYCEKAKVIGFEELDFGKKYEPLNINDIKDIDSIVGAIQERVYYTGNIVLGKSNNIYESTEIRDSSNIEKSLSVINSKNIYHGAYCRDSEGVFGCDWVGISKYTIHSFNVGLSTRCFEVYTSMESSDIMYSAYPQGCSHVMFSFRPKNKNYMIGNRQLEKDKYMKIKAGIQEQLVVELKKNKRLLSLQEIVLESIKYKTEMPKVKTQSKNEGNMKDINRGFKSACKLILGREIGDVESYRNYLNKRNLVTVEKIKSAVSGVDVYRFNHPKITMDPKETIVSYAESVLLSETLKMDEADIKDFETLKKKIWKIGYFTPECYEGKMNNIINSPQTLAYAQNCYEVAGAFRVLDSAFSFWPRDSRYTYGTSNTHQSNFCISTYNSNKLTRAFQVDSCEGCSDISYAHNCENVHDSMFCFNVKNLRNAIGNARLTLPEYKKIKVNIIKQIADELEMNKTLKWDVYNIGCVRSEKDGQ